MQVPDLLHVAPLDALSQKETPRQQVHAQPARAYQNAPTHAASTSLHHSRYNRQPAWQISCGLKQCCLHSAAGSQRRESWPVAPHLPSARCNDERSGLTHMHVIGGLNFTQAGGAVWSPGTDRQASYGLRKQREGGQ